MRRRDTVARQTTALSRAENRGVFVTPCSTRHFLFYKRTVALSREGINHAFYLDRIRATPSLEKTGVSRLLSRGQFLITSRRNGAFWSAALKFSPPASLHESARTPRETS
jgi:hypothetical protein